MNKYEVNNGITYINDLHKKAKSRTKNSLFFQPNHPWNGKLSNKKYNILSIRFSKLNQKQQRKNDVIRLKAQKGLKRRKIPRKK